MTLLRPIGVLFVCTGNICRSPTAAGVLRMVASEAGLAAAVAVDSAGTGGWHRGDPPDSRAQAEARRHGVEIGDLRARQVLAEDFHRFDLVVAMDRGHQRHLAGLAPPGTRERLRLFCDYLPDAPGEPPLRDVPDPYYGDRAGFARTYAIIDRGCRALFVRIAAQVAAAQVAADQGAAGPDADAVGARPLAGDPA